MELDFQDRVAVVTGGAQGIGRETALALAESGASVAIWDCAGDAARRAAEAISPQHQGEVVAFSVDVRDPGSVDRATTATLERFRRIDILINNAGIIRDAQLLKAKERQVVGKMTVDDYHDVLAVNLHGTFHCTQSVAPTMIQQRFGRIVSAASVVAHNGNFGQTNYVAAKTGVIGMTRVWARELGRHGITVNAIAPGFIETEMAMSVPADVLAGMVDHTPVGRLGTPREVADAYLFLVSEQASFINGAVLNVDGGLVIGT